MQRERILVVDDDVDVRESLVDELDARFDVCAVSCGDEAVATMDEHVFDVVISDLRMPGMSGVEVLEYAKTANPDAVRILLTGYLDEDARRATQRKGAPFKIGKPWHDTIDITVRRALEHRELERSLHKIVSDASRVSDIDEELAAQQSAQDLVGVAAQRVSELSGVSSVTIRMPDDSVQTLSTESTGSDELLGEPWKISEVFSPSLGISLDVHGRGNAAQQVARVLLRRASEWTDQDLTTRLARQARDPGSQAHLMAVTRNALLGTMASSVLHELASLVQGLHCPMMELTDFAEQHDSQAVREATAEALDVSSQVMQLFRSMRSFVRFGGEAKRWHSVKSLVEWAALLCHGYVTRKVRLHKGPVPDVELCVDSALIVQVIVSMLKTVADDSTSGQSVGFRIDEHADEVVLTVEHRVDEEGASPDVARQHVTSDEEPVDDIGLEFAMTSQIVRDHGGRISYSSTKEGGSRFVVALPRGLPDAQRALAANDLGSR